MSDFWDKNVQNSISAGAPPPPQTPYGELTAALLHWWSLQRSPDPWMHLRGPTSKGGEGKASPRGGEGEKEGRKKEFGPQSLPQIDAPDSRDLNNIEAE